MRPIGVIHTPYKDKDHMPIQAVRSHAIGQVCLYPEFMEGLQDLLGYL